MLPSTAVTFTVLWLWDCCASGVSDVWEAAVSAVVTAELSELSELSVPLEHPVADMATIAAHANAIYLDFFIISLSFFSRRRHFLFTIRLYPLNVIFW